MTNRELHNLKKKWLIEGYKIALKEAESNVNFNEENDLLSTITIPQAERLRKLVERITKDRYSVHDEFKELNFMYIEPDEDLSFSGSVPREEATHVALDCLVWEDSPISAEKYLLRLCKKVGIEVNEYSFYDGGFKDATFLFKIV